MTTHYIDIALLPDPESSPAHLLGALIAKLHRALVQLRADDIGISFPDYSLRPRALGKRLRLHGNPAALQRLMAQPWLQGMRDHVRITELAPAPLNAPHRAMRRQRFDTNLDRLRRRRMQRKNETAEQATQEMMAALQRRATTAEQADAARAPNLPYVQLHSASTGQPFCLFIEQGPEQATPVPGPFNSYGLSQNATIPWF